MLKPNKTRLLSGYSKDPTLPLTRTDSFVKATKGVGSKQSDGSTGNTGADSPDDNIITARLRQEGILPPLPPVDRTGTSDSVTPNKKTSQTSTPTSASSETITLPSKLKLDLFRQYISDVYAGQSDSAAPSGTVPKSGVLTPTPQHPLLGTKQSDPKASRTVSKTSDGSILTQTPEIAQLSELIAKLPSEFPIAEWDNMTSQQRLIAVRSSGLSPQEQWKLLNASGALSTIAAIQEIQGNSRAYGLTPEKADTISAGLLKIDSARTSVKKGGMPFATDMQRGLFLSQLDKEEQKLLDSVDGQKEGNNDKIYGSHPFGNPNHPRQVVVKEVKNGSKLALIAKDILKAYIGIQYILPITAEMISMQEVGKLIDNGTISLGFSGSASILGAGGPTVNIGLAMDSTGDVGVLRVLGGYAGIPTASLVVFASGSNAHRLKDLEGFTLEAGGSFGEGLCVGGEVGLFNDQSGKQKVAVNLMGGIGVSPLPFEGHVGVNNTYDFDTDTFDIVNIYDAWAKFVQEYLEW